MRPLLYLMSGLLLHVNVSAQGYVRLGAGYAFPAMGQNMDGYANPISGTLSNGRFEYRNASYTSGLHSNIAVGYSGAVVGFELNADAGIRTPKYTAAYTGSLPDNSYVEEKVYTQAKLPLVITPSVRLRTKGSGCLYTRIGIALPLRTSITIGYYGEVTRNGVFEYVYGGNGKLKTKFRPGMSGAIGYSKTFGRLFSVWVEASGMALSVYSKELSSLEYTSSGFGGGTYPEYTIPFSNLSCNAGIALGFARGK